MEDESDEDLYITQNVFTSDKVSDSDCNNNNNNFI
jgi:hypothetical protein